jgi:hypothetical protein
MAALLFTCPNTQMKAQHWLDDDEHASEDDYEGITCHACAGVHSSTGRASCWATTTPTVFPESGNLFDSDQRSSFQEAYWVDASYEALGDLRSRKGSLFFDGMSGASPIFAFAVDLNQ